MKQSFEKRLEKLERHMKKAPRLTYAIMDPAGVVMMPNMDHMTREEFDAWKAENENCRVVEYEIIDPAEVVHA